MASHWGHRRVDLCLGMMAVGHDLHILLFVDETDFSQTPLPASRPGTLARLKEASSDAVSQTAPAVRSRRSVSTTKPHKPVPATSRLIFTLSAGELSISCDCLQELNIHLHTLASSSTAPPQQNRLVILGSFPHPRQPTILLNCTPFSDAP